MIPERSDPRALREEAIPLPPREPDGYRHVLLLGTTGAGKTTLVRQLIGTDPSEERFPSTSTSKTTIHDTEIVLDEGSWRAVVTFVSRDEAREHLNECISAAVRKIVRDRDSATDADVLRRLLDHENQRFRFSYILGRGPKKTDSISDFDDEESEEDDDMLSAEDSDAIDLESTNELLGQLLERLRGLAHHLREKLSDDLGPNLDKKEDKQAFDELLEEECDSLLEKDEDFRDISDALMGEIEKRFYLLPAETVTKTQQDWPLVWQGKWPVDERRGFIKSVSRFSSNYAPWYGRLLTPLVSGVRVAGPFKWKDGQLPKLVLFDGEGLGHTPKSSSSVSTGVSRLIEAVDAVVLVDNATQPMQAAPLAAMRELVATGNGSKLILAFTHFDEVKGDNLPSAREKAHHVSASAENALSTFGEDLGSYAERILRKRLETARFFLENLQEPLSESTKSGQRTIGQLKKLLEAIDRVVEKPRSTEVYPVYDRMKLALAVYSAAEAFQEAWRSRLGLESEPGVDKEHWGRIKALNRRLAEMGKDEYDTLRPVADLRRELRDRTYVFIQNPLRWEDPEPTKEEKQTKYDALAENLSVRLLELSTRRVWRERIKDWERAYQESGKGSTRVRARIIGDDIYEQAAPVPKIVTSPDRDRFLQEVVAGVEAATEEIGARLQ